MPDPARLFLITPPIAAPQAFAPLLEAAMSAADVACVWLRSATPDEGDVKAAVRALSPIVQARDAALLISGDPRLVSRTGADGLHLAAPGPDLDEAIEALGGAKIVGVGGLRSRDDAMAAGESGVDYLMFGAPGERQDRDAVLERVSWWAEIFNVPCVGYARDPADAGAVARAGAEFVALCEGLWDDPQGIAATLQRVGAALGAASAEAVP